MSRVQQKLGHLGAQRKFDRHEYIWVTKFEGDDSLVETLTAIASLSGMERFLDKSQRQYGRARRASIITSTKPPLLSQGTDRWSPCFRRKRPIPL